MTGNYLMSSAFMLIVLLIFAKKTCSDIHQPQSRHLCLCLIGMVAAYVLMDAAFIINFISPFHLPGYRAVVFVFYVIYVVLPFVWHTFVRNFVGGTLGKAIRRLECVPLAALLAMVLSTPFTGVLWSVSDEGVYTRGPWFSTFAVLNLFYYVESLANALVICLRRRQSREPYLLQSVLISCIPLVGILVNSYIIPVTVVYPFQPFCLVIVTALAYFFIVERESKNLQSQYRKSLQLALQQARIATRQAETASKVKSDFLANMSHDIRTPLNAILGFSRIIADDPTNADAVENAVGKIRVSGNVLLSLINDVLELSRIENGRTQLVPEPTDLDAMAHELETMLTEGMQRSGISFRVTSVLRTPVVLCDKSKMRQILVNLLGNAQKFTQSGGTVSLAFEQTGEDAYRFTVRDTGIGISRSFQEHMFEAFERERTSTESSTVGTGLGLSIVKRLVELMDGRITVDSTPGSGTSIAVTLSLPPADSAPADAPVQEPPAQEAPASSLSGVHILLVEDNELNREIADTLLGAEGALVTNAVNGAEAVELFRSNPPGTFRLILMDIMMPVMDGLTAAKTIRALDRADAKTIPIFAMTANAFREDVTRSLDAGMNEHLNKPLDMEQLLSTIQKYL